MERNYKNYTEDTNETPQQRFLREEAYLKAQNRVKKVVGFYRHLMVYVLVNLFLIAIIAVNDWGSFGSFGTFSTAIFWGIGLAFHAVGVFGPNLVFGKNWENRMIKKYMDKENKRWE